MTEWLPPSLVVVTETAERPSFELEPFAMSEESVATDDESVAPDEGTCGVFVDGDPVLTLEPVWREVPAAIAVRAHHTDERGVLVEYVQIPRRADRPMAYDAYRYPLVPSAPVTSGYDLDLPDESQRRGERLRAVGHGGVDLSAELGAGVRMIRLDHQVGDAAVLYVGPLFGETTVATLHVLREGGEWRPYVLLFGHLGAAAPDVRRGAIVSDGDLVGFVGPNAESPEVVHLHLEARRVRDHVDPWDLVGGSLVSRELTVVTDPRNVLPLEPRVAHLASCAEQRSARRRAPLFADLHLELDLEPFAQPSEIVPSYGGW